MKTRIIILLCVFITMGAIGACAGTPQDNGVVVVKSKKDKKGWLGVSIQDVTRRLAKQNDLSTTSGAYVTDVVDDSPAEDAGIKDGDVIIKFDGKDVDDSNDLTALVRKTKPGTTVEIVVERDKVNKTLKAEIDRTKGVSAFSYNFNDRGFDIRVPKTPRASTSPYVEYYTFPSTRYGIKVENLTKQLAEYFNIPGKKGVLVTEVKKNSDAEKSGLKAGDVITKAGSSSVWSVDDLSDELKDLDNGDELDLGIIRNGQSSSIKIKVEQKDSDDDDDDWSLNNHSHGNGHYYYYNLDEDETEHSEALHEFGRTLRDNLRDGLYETKKELRKLHDELRKELDNL